MALHIPGKCRRAELHPQSQHFTLSTEAAVTPSLAHSQGPAASCNKHTADWMTRLPVCGSLGTLDLPLGQAGRVLFTHQLLTSGGSWGPVRNHEGSF